ncbi:hypothetical protein NECAME_02230, partial [Necator americanus]
MFVSRDIQAEIIISSDSDEAPNQEEISDSEPELGVKPKRKRCSKVTANATRPVTRSSNASVWKRDVDIKDAAMSASVEDIVYFDK